MKKFFWFLFFLIIFLSASLFYINKMFLPVYVKGFLLKTAQEQLKGRDISIGNLSFNPLKGLVIQRLMITAKHNPTRAFVQAEELSVQIFLPALLKKKIVIPSIRLDSPQIKLIRMDDALWNFSDLIPEKKEKEKKSPFQVVIGGVQITNGKVSIEDMTQKEEWQETLSSLNLQTSLHLSNPLNARVGLKGNFIVSSSGSVSFNAFIKLNQLAFKGNCELNYILIPHFLTLLPKDFPLLDIQIRDFSIQKLSMQALYSPNKFELSLNGSIPLLDIESLASFPEPFLMKSKNSDFDKLFISVSPQQGLRVEGGLKAQDLFLNFKNQYSIQAQDFASKLQMEKKENSFDLTGDLNTTALNANFDPIQIQGDLTLAKTSFSYSDSAMRVSTTLDGHLLSFKFPNLNIQAETLNSIVDFEKNNNHLMLNGHLSTKSFMGHFQENLKIEVQNMTLTNLSSSMSIFDLSSLAAKGSFNAQDFSLTVQNNLIRSTIDIPQFTINPQQAIARLNAKAMFKDLQFTNTQYKINSDLNLNALDCSLSSNNIFCQTPLSSQQTIVDLKTTLIKTTFNISNFSASFKNKTLALQAQGQSSKTEVEAPQGMLFTGESPRFLVNFALNLETPQNINYDGELSVQKGQLKNIPFLRDINDINSALSFNSQEVIFKSTSFDVFKTAFNLHGSIKDFHKPWAQIQFQAPSVDLTIINDLFPDIIKNEQLSIVGESSLDGSFEGLLSQTDKAKIIAKMNIKKTQVKSEKHQQALQNINGFIIYNHPKMIFENFNLTWNNLPLTFDGFLQDFLNPYAEGVLKTKDISMDFTIQKTNDLLGVKKLKASWLNSTLDASGDIHLSSAQPPSMNVNGSLKLSLKDLNLFLPQYQKIIDPLKLGGILKINFHSIGNPLDWQNLNSHFDIETPSLTTMGYALENIKISAQQKNGKINPLTLSLKAYEGTASATGSVTLTHPKFPFETSLNISKLNIEKIKNSTPALSSKQLSGLFTAIGNLKGDLLDYQNMTGKISMSIQNGYLWSIDALAGIAKLLASFVQSSKDLSITEASASWDFKNRQIITSDLILKGPSLLIKGQGWIDWDQKIEMSLAPEFLSAKPTVNEDGSTATQEVTLLDLLNPSSDLLHIRLFGALSQPQIEHNFTAPKMIKKTLQNTVGNLFKIFGGGE